MGAAENIQITENNEIIKLDAETFSIAVSKTNGLLTSYQRNGRELLLAPLTPNLWRPLTDNDRLEARIREFQSEWENAAEKVEVKSINFLQANSGEVTINTELWYQY